MTAAPIIPARHVGGALIPLRHSLALEEGEVVGITVERQRSDATHRHYFAAIREGWENLPESLQGEPYAKSPEHLRKYALIMTDQCHVQEVVLSGAGEAQAVARAVRTVADEYALIVASGNVLRIYQAATQSKAAMGAAKFKASKDAVLDWIGALLDVSREQLEAAE